METYKELTGQAPAFPQLQRGRPSATVRACANESLQPRAGGAARPYTSARRDYRRMLTFISSPNPISIVSTLLPP